MTTTKKVSKKKVSKKTVVSKVNDATTKKAVTKKDAKKEVKAAEKPKEEKPKLETDKKVKQVQERDTKTYVFNGEKYGKGQFVLASVLFYVEKHPKITLADMKKAFPDTLISRYGVFTDLKTAIEKSKTSGKKRYFINEDQTFEIGGKKYCVCNQITADIMVKFLEHLKGMGVKQR